MAYQEKYYYVRDRMKASYALYRRFLGQVWWQAMCIALLNTVVNNFITFKHSSKLQTFLTGGSVFLAILLNVFFLMLMFFRAEACKNNSPSQLTTLSKKTIFLRYYKAALTFAFVLTWCLIGILLGIIPGIVLFIFSVFYFPYIILKNETAWGALKKSVLLVKGSWVRTFLLYLIPFLFTFVFFIVVNVIFGIFGIDTPLWASIILEIIIGILILPYYVATTLEQFDYLRQEKESSSS